MPIKLLSIETSTDACSVALVVGDSLLERFIVAPQQHTQMLLPFCEAILAEAGVTLSQLDAIAVGQGPGSFTGVRMAISAAQGLAYACQRPIIPVSSLQALAQSAVRLTGATSVLAAIDARMHAVYWCAYAVVSGRAEPLISESECKPDAAEVPSGDYAWTAIGSGWDTYSGLIARVPLADRLPGCYPRARDIAWIAQSHFSENRVIDPAKIEAVYLRDLYPVSSKK